MWCATWAASAAENGILEFSATIELELAAVGVCWPATCPPGVMHALQCVFKVLFQRRERAIERAVPGNQNIVEARLRVIRCDLRKGRLQAPPDSVAVDGRSELLGHREAETGRLPAIL